MKIRLIRLWAVLLSVVRLAFGQIDPITPDNWTNAGYRGDIPRAFDILINMKDSYGLKGDGTTDDAPGIQRAITDKINNHPNQFVVLFFPVGNYVLNSSIQIPPAASKLVFIGQGSDHTKFIITHGNIAFNISSSTTSGFNVVPSGNYGQYLRGSSSFQVPFTGINANDFLEIQVSDGIWHGHYYSTNHYPIQDNYVGQIVKVIGATPSGGSTNLTLEEPLRLNYGMNQGYDLHPLVQKITTVNHIGFENITVYNASSGGESCYNFIFSYATDCWMWGVQSERPFKAHVYISKSSGIEIRGCYFYNAQAFGDGGQGYGITINTHSTDCLVEDNVFHHLRHAMMVQGGANGNVFGFNFSNDQYSPDEVDNGDISFHGTYPYDNLFEGNIALFADGDDYWGSNGPNNVLYRNSLRQDPINYCPSGNYWDHDGGIRLIGPTVNGIEMPQGFYVLCNSVEEGACWLTSLPAEFYNNTEAPINGYNAIVGHEDRGGPSGDNMISMYYTSKPSFLSASYSWPPVGSKYNGNNVPCEDIPASHRYYANGKITVSSSSYFIANLYQVDVVNDLSTVQTIGSVGAQQTIGGVQQWSSQQSPGRYFLPSNPNQLIRTESALLSYSSQSWRHKNWDDNPNFINTQLSINVNQDQPHKAIFQPAQPITIQTNLLESGSHVGSILFRGQTVSSPYNDYAFTPPNSTCFQCSFFFCSE